MNFHGHQDDARRRTRTLVAVFVLAVLMVVVGVNLLGEVAWRLSTGGRPVPGYFHLTNTAIVLLYVLGGAWLEWQRLREGGAAIMLRLGARHPDPYSLRERQLVNVAEEMSISAGVPVPELFVLENDTINAMVAGHDHAHSALLVTRGALENLTRSELQGVVAHEFAHLVNGDAALNTRLAGALYGLYSLHMLGRGMLRLALGVRLGPRRQTSLIWVPGLVVMGVVVTAVGWIGAGVARLVQAAVSRQREFLADAQAVQFTRDRDGMGRALRKVAGQRSASIGHEYAQLLAHFWLVRSNEEKWFDSHPPLTTRIRRIYGRPLPAIVPEHVPLPLERIDPRGDDLPPLAFAGPDAVAPEPSDVGVEAGLTPFEPASASLAREARASAEALLTASSTGSAPAAVLIAAAREAHPKLSRAALLLNAVVAGPAQLGDDEQTSDPALQEALLWLESPAAQWLRVPLIELLTARLRHWPLEFRRTLVRYCRDAVLADGRVEKLEWVYFTLVRHRLLADLLVDQPVAHSGERSMALAQVFAMAAALSDCSARAARDALVVAAEGLGIPRPAFTPEEFEFGSLDRALDALRGLPPLRKPALLRALHSLARQPETAVYRAFTTAVAAAIDCPPLRAAAVQKGAGQPSAEHTAS